MFFSLIPRNRMAPRQQSVASSSASDTQENETAAQPTGKETFESLKAEIEAIEANLAASQADRRKRAARVHALERRK